jgi:hypothetical protein
MTAITLQTLPKTGITQMTSWYNAPKEGKTFGNITIENDADLTFSSAIAVKVDENTIKIYGHVTGATVKTMDKATEFTACKCAVTIYLNDHTDSYGKERKVFASHKFIAAALDKIDGYNVYFSGSIGATNDKSWAAYETKIDAKGKPMPDILCDALLDQVAGFEAIEGKGDMEGVEIPKGGAGGYSKKSYSQGELFQQRLDWIALQHAEGSSLRTIQALLGQDAEWGNNIIETWVTAVV